MKSLSPKGARNSDVFPPHGVLSHILSHPSKRSSRVLISLESPWEHFTNEVI